MRAAQGGVEREAQSQLTNVKEARDRVKMLKNENRLGGSQGLKAYASEIQEETGRAERCIFDENDDPSPSNFADILDQGD